MDFENDAQKECYEKVATWMREIFGEFAKFPDDDPVIIISKGSAAALVIVRKWTEDDAVISVHSRVVKGAEITPDLMEYLLRKNASMVFGAFSLSSDNDIDFEHTIIGSTCDKPELRASVLAVLGVADKFDDEIMSQWGGKRATE